MEKHILTEDEEKSLVGILYNHLSFGTTLELLGELQELGIKRIDLQRSILAKLLKKFNLVESLTNENYLLLGMINFCDKNYLLECKNNEKNKHLQNRAKYFLKKVYGE
jgi:hypothetical protein